MRESVDQVLTAYHAMGLEARRVGHQYQGPCPFCGGKDRWHVGPDGAGGALMSCRQCLDFGAIADSLGLGRRRSDPALDTTRTIIKESARAERERRHTAAARRARTILSQSRKTRHPYLTGKGFPDLMLPVWRDKIAVPVWGDGLQSMQLIDPNGGKRFLSGGRMTGGRAVIGPCDPSGRHWHVEGLATGLSVRRALAALDLPDCVVICFSAAGLRISGDYRRSLLIIDHDWHRCPRKHRWDYPAQVCPMCGDCHVTRPVSAYADGSGSPWWQPPEPGDDANDYEQTHGTGALAAALKQLLIGRQG